MTPKERAEKIGEFADNALAEEFKLSWAIAEAERQIREAVNEAYEKAAQVAMEPRLFSYVTQMGDASGWIEPNRREPIAKAIREMKV